MSTPSAEPAADAAPKKGKKKLIVILAAVLLVVLAGGGAAVVIMKKKAAAAAAAAAEEDGDGADAEEAPAPKADDKKHGDKKTPTFVPLDPFVVNLADKETERFAQVGVTLEVDDPKFAEQIKAYMPAIRNGILMVLAHKTSTELLEREGKQALAKEILRESVRPMGIEVPDEEEETAEPAGARKKKKKKKVVEHNPVTAVHFSNFIIQ